MGAEDEKQEDVISWLSRRWRTNWPYSNFLLYSGAAHSHRVCVCVNLPSQVTWKGSRIHGGAWECSTTSSTEQWSSTELNKSEKKCTTSTQSIEQIHNTPKEQNSHLQGLLRHQMMITVQQKFEESQVFVSPCFRSPNWSEPLFSQNVIQCNRLLDIWT